MQTHREGETEIAAMEDVARSTPKGVARSPLVGPSKPRLLKVLGPALISGAADDDPTAIATYSQAGARAGYGLCWLMPLVYPLMVVVQQVSARVGRTTGHGLAGNIRRHCPGWFLYVSEALTPKRAAGNSRGNCH